MRVRALSDAQKDRLSAEATKPKLCVHCPLCPQAPSSCVQVPHATVASFGRNTVLLASHREFGLASIWWVQILLRLAHKIM